MDSNDYEQKLNKLIQEKGHLIAKPDNTEVELSSKWMSEIQASNVSGSTAGAGSGEFHVFKNQRRKEMFRMKGMYEETVKEIEEREWLAKKRAREEVEQAKAERRRKKRMKRKQHKGTGVKSPNPAGSEDSEPNDTDPEKDESEKDGLAAAAAAEGGEAKVEEDKVPDSLPTFIAQTSAEWNWVRVNVSVTSEKHMSQITGVGADGRLLIDVAAPSKPGQVNKELVAYLSHKFAVAKNDVTIVAGHSDGQKTLQLQGVGLGRVTTLLSRTGI
jgi:uncharacterized protein YggU (UPF0235/DUF167 family)